MTVKTMWDRLARSSRDFPHGLLTADQLLHCVRREKARTDRTHIPFSVLSLNADFRTATGRNLFEQILEFSKYRLRMIDDLALTHDGVVTILLPTADAVGGAAVASDYERQFKARVQITSRTYPSDWYDPLAVDWDDSSPGDSDGDNSDGDGRVRPKLGQPVKPTDYMLRRMPAWKRVMDIVGSGVGLIALSPLLLTIAILIKTSSSGPVFYRQRRTGLGGVPFWIYKFRSMVTNADAIKGELAGQNEQDGPAFKIKDDPRITPIGRFIRRTSMDELPQLWNVFCGNMTIVGPRPLPVEETAGCESWHLERLQVTPGLTCIWQVHGRSRVTFDEWMKMDVEYLRDISFGRDVKLIGQTAWSLVFKKDGM